MKYMLWAIATIGDVLNYQTGEQLDEHLDMIVGLLRKMEDEGVAFDEQDYEELHCAILKSGLSTLPNTQKAIDKYGY